jgi:hypothetical protein
MVDLIGLADTIWAEDFARDPRIDIRDEWARGSYFGVRVKRMKHRRWASQSLCGYRYPDTSNDIWWSRLARVYLAGQ